jgi:hypothetical protein
MLVERSAARPSRSVRALVWTGGVFGLGLLVLAVQQLLAEPAGADTPGLVDGVVSTVEQVVDPAALEGVTSGAAEALPAAPDVEPSAIGSPGEAPAAEASAVDSPALDPLDPVVEPLAPAASPLAPTVQAAAPFVEAAAPVLEVAAPVVTPLVEAAGPVAEAAAPVVDAVAPVTTPIVEVVAPVVGAVAPVVGAVEPVVGAVEPVVEVAAPVVAPVVGAVAPVVAPVVDAVVPAVTTVVQALPPVMEGVVPVVAPLVGAIGSIVDSVAGAGTGPPTDRSDLATSSLGDARQAVPASIQQPSLPSGTRAAPRPVFGALRLLGSDGGALVPMLGSTGDATGGGAARGVPPGPLALAVPSAVPGGLGGPASGGAGPSVLLAVLAVGVPGLGLARGGVVHDRAARLIGLVHGPGCLPG